MERPLEEFDIHKINHLIQREQIPGFKMLPEEAKYLEEYRNLLKQLYVGEQGKTYEVKRQIVPEDIPSEDVVEVKVGKSTNKKKRTYARKTKVEKTEETTPIESVEVESE